MPNALDPYREALVVETKTVWPADLPGVPSDDSAHRQIEERLHADPARAAELDYVRLHAGFIRKITVTMADLERLVPRVDDPVYRLGELAVRTGISDLASKHQS